MYTSQSVSNIGRAVVLALATLLASAHQFSPQADASVRGDRMEDYAARVAPEEVVFLAVRPEEEDKLNVIVEALGNSSGRPEDRIRSAFDSLWQARAGAYVQLDGALHPLELAFYRTTGTDAFMTSRGTNLYVSLNGEGREVAVFWIKDPERQTYEVHLPDFVTHATIMANGHVISSMRRLPSDGAPLIIHVEGQK